MSYHGKELREWYKSHGICCKCGAANARKGRTLCPDCADKQSAYSAKRYRLNKTEHLARCHKRQKFLYEERKSKGLCVVCGKQKSKAGKTRCAICAVKSNKRQREYNHQIGRIPYDLRTSPDVCYICGGEPLPGKRLCVTHYDIAMQNLKKANEHRDNTNHIWRKLRYGKEQKE